jgi:AraC family transcriptional regulator
MTEATHATIDKPRIQSGAPLALAGRRESFTASTMQNVPALWMRFIPEAMKLGTVTQTYGLVFDRDSGVDYMAAIVVPSTVKLPAGWTSVRLPAQTYAVFPHRAHVSKIGETVMAACEWLGRSNHRRVDGNPDRPAFLEHYSEAFDPNTGMGGMEVWVPIKG